MNEPRTYSFRLLYPNEWFAFTHWDWAQPLFETILSFARKRDGASHLVHVSFADDSQVSAFIAYLHSRPLVADVVTITDEEFHATTPDHTRYLKRYRNA